MNAELPPFHVPSQPDSAAVESSNPTHRYVRRARILLSYLVERGSFGLSTEQRQRLAVFESAIHGGDLTVAQATAILTELTIAAWPVTPESFGYSLMARRKFSLASWRFYLILLVGGAAAALYALAMFPPKALGSFLRPSIELVGTVIALMWGYFAAGFLSLIKITDRIDKRILTPEMLMRQRAIPVSSAFFAATVYVLMSAAVQPRFTASPWSPVLGCLAGIVFGWWSDVSKSSLRGQVISTQARFTNPIDRASEWLSRPFAPRSHLLIGVLLAAAVMASFALAAEVAPPFVKTLSILGSGKTALLIMTISAGAVGAWAHTTGAVFTHTQIGTPDTDSVGYRPVLPGVRLAFGAFAGFAGALLVPMGLIAGNGSAVGLNPPVAALIALACGYSAARLLESLLINMSAPGQLEARVVEQGVKNALAPRSPVNYEGVVYVSVADPAGNSALMEGMARLSRGIPYELVIGFVGANDAPPVGMVVQRPIVIRDGTTSAKVPFDARIDLGFIDLSPQHASFEVPASGESSKKVLQFTVPEYSEVDEGGTLSLTVSVYQYDSLCESCVIPISLAKS